MSNATLDIDHVIIGVNDLDAAADIYRRIGFTLSPRGVHSASMGTANHTIMLGRDYFELLAVIAPTERNASWRHALVKGDGALGVALSMQDSATARDAWRAAGIAASDIVAFSRPVECAGHATVDARFEVVHAPEDSIPGIGVFGCRHFTPEAVWLPELQTHANTATGIASLTIETPDPSQAAAAWRRLLGDVRTDKTGDSERLQLPAHTIDLVAAPGGRAGQRIAGIRYSVADMGRCREALARGGIRHTGDATFATVEAADACGVTLAFAV